MRRRHVIAGLLRTLLGGVFVYAGIVKILAAADFADAIAGFRLLPPGWSNLLALGLPPFEILLGAWLLAGWKRRTAAFCALVLSGVFLFALVSAAVRGIAVDCGCFGAAPGSPSAGTRLWLAIGRDVALLAAAGARTRRTGSRRRPPNCRATGPPAAFRDDDFQRREGWVQWTSCAP